MAGRYYVVPNPAGLNQARALLATVTGRRDKPDELVHWRLSCDGTKALMQAETNLTEHNQVMAIAGVQFLGGFFARLPDIAVHTFLRNNAAEWECPRPGGLGG